MKGLWAQLDQANEAISNGKNKLELTRTFAEVVKKMANEDIASLKVKLVNEVSLLQVDLKVAKEKAENEATLRAVVEVELSTLNDEVNDFDLMLEHLRRFLEFDEYEHDLEANGLDIATKWLKTHTPDLDTSALLSEYNKEWEAVKGPATATKENTASESCPLSIIPENTREDEQQPILIKSEEATADPQP